jgi:hypothetical protein
MNNNMKQTIDKPLDDDGKGARGATSSMTEFISLEFIYLFILFNILDG